MPSAERLHSVLPLCCRIAGNQLTLAGPERGFGRKWSSKQGEPSRSHARLASSSAPPAPSASDESTCSSEPGGRGRLRRGWRGLSPTAPWGACPEVGCSRRASLVVLLRPPCLWSGGRRLKKIPFASPSSLSRRSGDREAFCAPVPKYDSCKMVVPLSHSRKQNISKHFRLLEELAPPFPLSFPFPPQKRKSDRFPVVFPC